MTEERKYMKKHIVKIEDMKQTKKYSIFTFCCFHKYNSIPLYDVKTTPCHCNTKSKGRTVLGKALGNEKCQFNVAVTACGITIRFIDRRPEGRFVSDLE
jgi:hypothetical protein